MSNFVVGSVHANGLVQFSAMRSAGIVVTKFGSGVSKRPRPEWLIIVIRGPLY